jgi:hypothetical protein
MAQRILATASTGAVADPNQVAFSLRPSYFKYGPAIVSVEGLANAETLSFWVWTNGDWEELDDGSGTQVAFTATYAADVFNGPGVYGFTKDVTAGAVTLSVNDAR